VIPLSYTSQHPQVAVDYFLATLTLYAKQTIDASPDVSATEADEIYKSIRDKKDTQLTQALRTPAAYQTAVNDLLFTVQQFSTHLESSVARAMLLDWVTAAPEFCLDRCQSLSIKEDLS